MPFRIKELRQKKGWTQKVLAEKSGVSQNLIARIESGDLVSTTTSTLSKLGKALETDPNNLFFADKV